jgi:uncharacterized protein YukE
MVSNKVFMVDLASLSDAIDKVAAEREAMAGKIDALRQTFTAIGEKWMSPAGTTFVGGANQFNAVTGRFMSVLDDAIGRMRSTYNTYLSVEQTNTHNLQ